jgi:diguanylate cyclase (GGDEF)-like protein
VLEICLGLGQIGLCGRFPYVLTHTVASVLHVQTFLLLWRGSHRLFDNPVLTREQAGLGVICGSLIIVFGWSPETAQQRVAIVLFAIAWVTCRASAMSYTRLHRERVAGAAVALILTGWTVGLVLIARGVSGLLSDAPIEFSHDSPVTLALAYVLLVAIFAVNLVFAYVVLQRVVRELTWLSMRDPLTGLFNRRAIVDALQREWEQRDSGERMFAVVCVDVDHFKAINDRHGHAAGDAVLAGLARRMSACVRDADTLARSGGEEFMLLLPATDQAVALDLAQRVCRSVAHARGLRPEEGCRVTVSIGVSSSRACDPSIDAILARADAALYRAKAAGRNCVRSDADPVLYVDEADPESTEAGPESAEAQRRRVRTARFPAASPADAAAQPGECSPDNPSVARIKVYPD